jgi:hypothetical protein
LREQYSEQQALDAMAGLDSPGLVDVERRIVAYQKTAIPRTITHTGTGLYAVKAVPTHNDDTQSGAPAGQVITLAVGGLGVLDAFKGGYVVNATDAETRAIVSHTDDTITLEGDLTNWTNTDDLDIYDAWTTVQGAFDQLFTDQGVTDFTSTQEVRLYDGTYTEDVDVASMDPTDACKLRLVAGPGQSSVVVTNTGLAAHTIDLNATEATWVEGFTIVSTVSGQYGIYTGEGLTASALEIYDTAGLNGRGIRGGTVLAVDSEFTDLNYGIVTVGAGSVVLRCKFDGCVSSARDVGSYANISACTFIGGTYSMRCERLRANPGMEYSPVVTNCTFYNVGTVFYDASSTDVRVVKMRFYNNIVHTATAVFYSGVGAILTTVDADYNTYYTCTNVANINGTTYNLAAWQALTDLFGDSPDSHSVSTDPGLSNPVGGDLTLSVTSNCIHAGVGSYVVCSSDVDGNAYDKWHPDKGAWSSGVGPNKSWGG